MSSYVFQFFCGPEGIALANPGGARARPALAAPPPRARVEFISEPVQPAARLRPRSEGRERPRALHVIEGAETGPDTTAEPELLAGDLHPATGADTAAINLQQEDQQRPNQQQGGQ